MPRPAAYALGGSRFQLLAFSRPAMRARFQVAAIFTAVGLGALTVTLLRDPGALIPHAPYGDWIVGRAFALGSLAALGMILVLGLEDEFADVDDSDDSRERPMNWFVIGLAFLISALASATFVGVSAWVDYLDRAAA